MGIDMQMSTVLWAVLSCGFLLACFSGNAAEQKSPAGGKAAGDDHVNKNTSSSVLNNPLQAAVQKILNDAVADGRQTAAQCCVYIDGKMVVDAWAGTFAKDDNLKVDGQSLFPVFSTEKPLLATAVHRAVELGKLRYEMKIADVWPEFACNGKESLTLEHVLSHRAGVAAGALPGTTDAQFCDWDFMVRQCAEMTAINPGQKAGYLSRTYAWLLGEPLSRVMGKPINDVLRDLVLIPSGIEHDFYFSVDDEALPRCVTVYNGKHKSGFEQMNQSMYRKACIPSMGAMANARSVAKFYVRLTGMDGHPPLLKPQTLADAIKPCRWEGEPIPDDLEQRWQIVWGRGYGLWGKRDEIGRIFGQGGVGGSEGYADPENRIAVGYTCAINGVEETDLRPAIYQAVGIKTRYSK